MDWQGKRYWIVGASEGLGRALAHKLSRVGVEVVVSARSEDRLKSLVEELPGKASYVTVDVSDLDAVEAARAEVGEIDGVVYLAGVYWPMESSAWNNKQAEAMADINYLGASRVVGSVINDFTARDHGHIVVTSSLTAFRGLPGTIGYTASKAAVMSLAECMYADLRKTGVNVQVVNPGFVKTQLTEKNDFNMPFIMEPEEAATAIFEHMNNPESFKKSFPAVFSWLFRLGQFLPDWAYYGIFRPKG
ncbi:MAG: NADP-dependent 3-hydroxy acid dehydrogenase YdfG [Loktanella salsilacus]|uniref:NADP-dependent 3-hydroxy acid dehydrogenase YdfG n=1 Tax=Loktanella salsilacus TaxID=195913 RepID=A0A1I4GTB5_9RHOB|nr:SDR family NAD(P)-dependent oxidoreductase [Loktanella salsilacus]SFL32713.1 NADP-dependent 3-hydroxy acid dehydrogenase YdfG [Loktanella salsilacus]